MVATEENKNILKMNKAAVQLFLNEYLIWLAIDGSCIEREMVKSLRRFENKNE